MNAPKDGSEPTSKQEDYFGPDPFFSVHSMIIWKQKDKILVFGYSRYGYKMKLFSIGLSRNESVFKSIQDIIVEGISLVSSEPNLIIFDNSVIISRNSNNKLSIMNLALISSNTSTFNAHS